MGYAFSLFLIAVGAILRYAVTGDFEGVDLQTLGNIMMVVGVFGLVVTFATYALWSDRDDPGPPTNVIDGDPLRPVRRRRRWYRRY